MRIAHKGSVSLLRLGVLLWLCLSLCAVGASADGKMPTMPEPPTTPVYWQLTGITEEPTVTPARGYAVSYHGLGFPDDLTDGLMAESIQRSEAEQSGLTLTINKDGVAMAHQYTWTPLPIYLEPGMAYPITITGTESNALGSLNSLLSVNYQGEAIERISAGGYTGHKNSFTFDITTSSGLYKDGSLVVSFVLRDTNDMFRLRVAYTYTMFVGIKPVPTPIPGFVAVEAPAGAVPSYYDAVEGKDGLWRVTTAPDEHRAYGSMSGSDPMFFPADADGNVAMNAPRVDPAVDFASFVQGFVPEAAQEVPPQYTIVDGQHYGFITRDGQTVLRAFGRMNGGPAAFYPVDETGVVADNTEPADPAVDFETWVKGFGSALPQVVPPHYAQVGEGLYAFTGRDGQTYYRTYGRLDGADPAFYPTDAAGAVLEGAQPVAPEADFENYIKGFDIIGVVEPPSYYRVISDGFFALDDREGDPVYRVYGTLDGMAPAYYPADASGNRIEGAAAVLPEEDFEAFVKGFVPEEMPDAPLFYDETDVPSVWSFIDLSGQTQYRAFGSLNRTEPAFYPSDAAGAVDSGALPINPASDLANMPPPAFAVKVPGAIPSWYSAVDGVDGLYTMADRDGNPVYRVFGAYGRGEPGFYPADAMGIVLESADVVDPAKDFEDFVKGFVPLIPQTAPSFYEAVEGTEGIYRFMDRLGQPVYRIYGAVDRGEPGFYPSDEWGNLLSESPVIPEEDVALLPTPYAAAVIQPDPTAGVSATPVSRTMPEGFKPAVPGEMPSFYEPVEGTEGIYRFTNHQGQTEYRIYGTKDRGDPGFFPSDEWGNLLSDMPVAPDADIALLPTPYQSSVNDPGSSASPDNTPIARAVNAWDRGTEPVPTNYVAHVETSAVADPATTDSVVRSFTPSPEVTAEAVPTSYFSSVKPSPTDLKGETVAVISNVTNWTTQPVDAQPTDIQNVTKAPDPTRIQATATVGTGTPAPTTGTPTPTQVQGTASSVISTEVPTPSQGTATESSSTQAPPVETPAATDVVTEAPPTDAASAEPTKAPEDKPGQGGSLWWIAIVVAGVAAIGGGVYAALGKKKK